MSTFEREVETFRSAAETLGQHEPRVQRDRAGHLALGGSTPPDTKQGRCPAAPDVRVVGRCVGRLLKDADGPIGIAGALERVGLDDQRA
jgi:hypothetical protein